MAAKNLTAIRLRELFHYDPHSGLFTRKVRSGNAFKVGQIAGGKRTDGYIAMTIQGETFFAHRLVWLWMTGEWPTDEIDHEDRDRSNNRWANLRLATSKQNNENQTLRKDNRSGFTGVGWCSKTKKWRARIRHHDKLICLGYYELIDDAVAARSAGEQTYFTHSRRSNVS